MEVVTMVGDEIQRQIELGVYVYSSIGKICGEHSTDQSIRFAGRPCSPIYFPVFPLCFPMLPPLLTRAPSQPLPSFIFAVGFLQD